MAQNKFFELIRPDHNFDFVGKTRLLLLSSAALVVLSFLMLPINLFIPGRGHVLNFAVDFRGGSEVRVDFSKDFSPTAIHDAMEEGGYKDSEVVSLPEFKNAYLIRFPAVSALSPELAKRAESTLREKLGQDSLRKFEFSEGGDKAYVRLSKPVEPSQIQDILRGININTNQVQRFGRPEDNTYEIVLVGLTAEIRKALEAKLGPGSVAAIPSLGSISAKAGKELRDNGIVSLLAAIGFSPSRDRLVVLGDLVNRGPGSLATLQRLRGLGDAATCLLGNHDLHLLAVACGGRKAHRSDTLAEVLASPERGTWLEWLRQRRMAVMESGWLCVHAGVVPQWTRDDTLARAAEVEAMLRSDALDGFLHQMYADEPLRWSPALEGNERLRFIINVLTRIRFVNASGALDLKTKEGAGGAPSGFYPWFDAPERRSAGVSGREATSTSKLAA